MSKVLGKMGMQAVGSASFSAVVAIGRYEQSLMLGVIYVF